MNHTEVQIDDHRLNLPSFPCMKQNFGNKNFTLAILIDSFCEELSRIKKQTDVALSDYIDYLDLMQSKELQNDIRGETMEVTINE
jgi:hypothetical protein